MKLLQKMIIALLTIAFMGLAVYVFMHQSKFGRMPAGKRLEQIKKSANYKNGSFQNLSVTPQITENTNIIKIVKDMLSAKSRRPKQALPSIKTDLLNLNKNENILVWFGHSSYFIQVDGIKILIDPVFSGNASPFSFMVKAFKGTDIYAHNDFPILDYLIITHDHWDHLDYKTVMKLKPKIDKIICGLGVGEHFEKWGFKTDQLIEKDWYETVQLNERIKLSTTPARHFSGRGLSANKSLWMSFVLQTPTQKIFMGGDGGYDTHFTKISEKFGPFDLVILENGQYNKSWKYIHMMPQQVLQAARDLKAKRLFPVHSMKFALANHAWSAPFETITQLNEKVNIPLITPKIGEAVNLNDTLHKFSKWWKDIE